MSIFDQINPLLKELTLLDPHVHVAGGALRDWEHSIDVKDIDVYVPSYIDNLQIITVMEGLNYKLNLIYNSFYSNPNITSSKEYICRDNKRLPVNIISLEKNFEVRDNINTFDFGICRLGVNKNNHIFMTKEYRMDKENKQFTLLKADNQGQFNNSVNRWVKRLSQKYPKHQMIIPSELKSFAENYDKRT